MSFVEHSPDDYPFFGVEQRTSDILVHLRSGEVISSFDFLSRCAEGIVYREPEPFFVRQCLIPGHVAFSPLGKKGALIAALPEEYLGIENPVYRETFFKCFVEGLTRVFGYVTGQVSETDMAGLRESMFFPIQRDIDNGNYRILKFQPPQRLGHLKP